MTEQTEQRRDHLVILSLPFQRLIRSHMSPMVLEILTKRANVIIVSPFAEDLDFVKQYKGERLNHAIAPTKEGLPFLFRYLVAISSILRTRGYYFRNRKHSPYDWAIRYMRFGENGDDTVISLPKRVVLDILAWMGLWPKAWRFLDSLIGRWSFNMPQLATLACGYDRVTLIQAASWGFQDQALAWMGRKYRWRTVLLPYTVDQLFCNGYLYSDFDAVCVQGAAEKRFAHILHNVPAHKVIELGSTYLRTLKAIAPPENNNEVSAPKLKNRVMYAGLVPTYFPAACEIEAVNMLSSLNVDNVAQGITLVYRPARFSQDCLDAIQHQLAFPECVELQIPSPTSLGLAVYTPTDSVLDMQRLLADLEKVDVMVTSMITSLSFEAAFMGVPTIAYYPEENAVLRARKTFLSLNKENRTMLSESIPVANNLHELGALVKQLLGDPLMRRNIVEATLRNWDYQNSNYSSLLEDAVFGDA